MTLRVGALFAGYGGLERAIEAVFEDVVVEWVSEYEPPTEKVKNPKQGAARILAHNYPDVPNLGDVTAIDWSTVAPVDLLGGGSPCQDVSHAGKRQGMRAGTRSGLWESMREGVAVLRPRFVVWENVRGALSAEADSSVEFCAGCVGGADDGPVLRALGRVLGDLADLGYDASWCGLRAADVGAPHGRFRVFVLAWRRDDVEPAADARGEVVDLRPGPGAGDTGSRRGRGRGRPDDGAAPAAAVDGDLDLDVPAVPLVEPAGALLPTPVVNDMGAAYTPETWDEWTARLKASHGNGNGHGDSLSVETLRMLPTPLARDGKGLTGRAGAGENLNDALADLLPTPSVADSEGGHERRGGARGDELLLNGVAKALVAGGDLLPTPRATRGGSTEATELLLPTPVTDPVSGNGHARDLGSETLALFPTPRATDGTKGGPGQRGSSGDLMLPSAVLLPTPTATDAKASGGAVGSPNVTLTDATTRARVDFGKYAPAIARWERALGRPAPDPTRPDGKNGTRRLSPLFVEWMMGLPAGWVTDPSIWPREEFTPSAARNAQLKALGNGIVPQQAAAALRHLLDVRAHALTLTTTERTES